MAGPNPRSQSYLQNPYYFMFAALAKPDEDVELHWLKVCVMILVSISVFSSKSSLSCPFSLLLLLTLWIPPLCVHL